MNPSSYLGIVTNEELLREEHIPERLPRREPQIEELRACLMPAVRKRKPLHAWIYGPPGAGKTTTVKFMLGKLNEETGVRWIYVDCDAHRSFHAVVNFLLLRLNRVIMEKDSALKLDSLGKAIGEAPFVIVLDEIDQMPAPERNRTVNALAKLGNGGLCCISYSKEKLFSLPSSIASKLNAKEIGFRPYTADDLAFILVERAERALVAGSWGKGTLEKIAEVSEGNARLAIQTLRAAAEHAENAMSESIAAKHIELGFSKTRENIWHYLRRRMNEHQLMLLDIVKALGSVESSRLREEYLLACAKRSLEAMKERTVDEYLKDMRYRRLISRKRAPVKGRVYVYSLC